MLKITHTIIEAAIAGFEAQKHTIDAQIAELRAMLTGPPETAAEETPAKGTRRKISPEGLKRMREGQKRRWAKIRGESAPAKTTIPAAKPKRKLSAAGRKAIREGLKKRWAAKRAAA